MCYLIVPDLEIMQRAKGPTYPEQFVFDSRSLEKMLCGSGSSSQLYMLWPHSVSAPRSITWAVSR